MRVSEGKRQMSQSNIDGNGGLLYTNLYLNLTSENIFVEMIPENVTHLSRLEFCTIGILLVYMYRVTIQLVQNLPLTLI